MKLFVRLMAFFIMSAAFSSCQKAVFDEDDGGAGAVDGVAIRFQVTQFEQIPFGSTSTSRATDVGKACTQINFAIYQNGTRVKQINQKASDADFGAVNLSLKEGRYLVVVLAHSCDGIATMTDPAKITFPNNKVTDTFWYSDSITVEQDCTYQLKLKRAVAMFRLQATDAVTADVKMVRLYNTGGSSTFDAINGVGCVNSKQWENFNITDDMVGTVRNFEVYSFPKADNKGLNVKVTTHDKNSNRIFEKEIANAPIQRNVITVYKGRLFSKNADSKGDFNVDLSSDDEWTTNEFTF